MSHRFFLQSYQHLVGTQLAHSWSFDQTHTGTHDKLYKRIWSNQLRWGGKIVTRNVGLRQGNNTQPDRADLSVIDRCSVIRETHTLKCNGKLSLRAANHTLSLLSFSDYSKLSTSGQTKPDITVYPHHLYQATYNELLYTSHLTRAAEVPVLFWACWLLI